MIIGAAWDVVAVGIGVPFDWELLWALAIVVGETHMDAAAQHERCDYYNNLFQFFLLSTLLINS
jgi:hypothetical protein